MEEKGEDRDTRTLQLGMSAPWPERQGPVEAGSQGRGGRDGRKPLGEGTDHQLCEARTHAREVGGVFLPPKSGQIMKKAPWALT